MYKPTSELQAALASAFSQCRYTTVIEVTAAVENDVGDSLCDCSLGNHLADFGCRLLVSAVSLEILFKAGSGYEGHALDIINDLRRNVRVGTINAKARGFCRAGDLASDSRVS